MTKPGRRILEKLVIRYHEHQGAKTLVPVEIRSKIRVDAIPRYVYPEYNEDRHKARAKKLADPHAGGGGARCVDVAEYASRRGFAVVVIDAGESIRTATSTTSSKPEEAEAVAVALAIKYPGCSTILSDSWQAIRNFDRGGVFASATKTLDETPRHLERARTKWFAAHAGEVSDTNTNSTRPRARNHGPRQVER